MVIFLNLKNKSIEIIKNNFKVFKIYATSLEFSIDLKYLYIGYSHGNINVFEVDTLSNVFQIQNKFKKEVSNIQYLNEGFFLASSNAKVCFFKHSKSFLIYHEVEEFELKNLPKFEIKSCSSCEI